MYLSESIHPSGAYAKVVADSIANDIRLTTLEIRVWLPVWAEFMTHRMFSRNAASNRAIPTKTIIEQVQANPGMPVFWGKNQPGMVADEEGDKLTGASIWQGSLDSAILSAYDMLDEGFHKQIVNRLLMPYQFITAVVSATEWDNFFKLRLAYDAQPEIRVVAVCIEDAMSRSRPERLDHNQWHLPYINFEKHEFNINYGRYRNSVDMGARNSIEDAIKCSVARCARVSYLTHNKENPDVAKDLELYEQLLSSRHMSPFEHVATPVYKSHLKYKGITHIDINNAVWSNNFRGWIQHRALV